MSWTFWTLFFMIVLLKIPMAGAGYLVWYAIKSEPEPAGETDADSGKGPRRKPPPFPRWPRRGPVGGGAECKELPCPEDEPSVGRPATVIARSRD